MGVTLSVIAVAVASYFYVRSNRAWWLCGTGAGITVLLACIVGLCKSGAPRANESVYKRKSRYISRAEWEFLQVLRNILGNRYEVCVQAPLVAVVDKAGSAFRNELFRVIDYLVVHPVSYEPLLLIELNDASHERADRRARDQKVAEICAAAKMPLIAFTAAQSHDVAEVRKAIFKALR